MNSSRTVTDLGRHIIPTPFATPAFADRRPEQVSAVATASAQAQVYAVGLGKSPSGELVLRPESTGLLTDPHCDVLALAQELGFKGGAGEYVKLPMPTQVSGVSAAHLVLLGMGKASFSDLRTAAATLMKKSVDIATVATSAAAGLPEDDLAAFVEGLCLGGFQVPSAGTGKTAFKDRPTTIELVGVTHEHVIGRALRVGLGTVRSRELCSMQSSVKTPAWLANEAVTRSADLADVTTTIWDEKELTKRGFGGILAVGSAAEVPPRLIQVDYHPAGATKHVVLVGKGVTYDTGGISLKPSDAMVMMRTDMSGSAAVLEAAMTAAALKLPVRVTAVVGAAENTIDRSAYRPSDVVTCYGGKTVEIANTDAEGRMVLADALAFVAETYQPDLVIDAATLTGAATLGLGRTHAAMYSTADETVVADLVAAGELSGEKVWHMPLVEDYRVALESDTADISHIGGPRVKVGGGSIVAALFLEEFTNGLPWVHLDIAGPGRATKDSATCPTGATGFGVRVLTEFLTRFSGANHG